METDNDVKLKFGSEFNIDEIFSQNWNSGVFQTMKIICKDGAEVQVNPLLLSLVFPWLRGKVNIQEIDLVLLPEHHHSTINNTITHLIKCYKTSLKPKCEVKLEDLVGEEEGEVNHPAFQNDKKFSDEEYDVKHVEDIDDNVEDEHFQNHVRSEDSDDENVPPPLSVPDVSQKFKRKKKKIGENMIQKQKCDICDIKLSGLRLKIHMRKLHADETLTNVEKETRDKEDKSQSKGSKQPRKHKPRLCPECGKSVKNLSKHSLIHKGIKPERLQCHVCEKTLCSANALKVHIESVHEGIKRYPCKLCSTSFVYEAYLKQHIQVVHEGYRPPAATCPDCGKQFKFTSNMTRHRRITHEGESIQRRHFCQICKSVFMKVSLLHKHLREEHGVNPRKRGEVRRALESETEKLLALPENDKGSSVPGTGRSSSIPGSERASSIPVTERASNVSTSSYPSFTSASRVINNYL